VLVWRVCSLCAASAPLSPFVGRHPELVEITAVLARLRLTGNGVTILIRGNAGIGKSRLVTEIRTRASLEGFDVPLGQVLDFGVTKGKAAVPGLLKTNADEGYGNMIVTGNGNDTVNVAHNQVPKTSSLHARDTN
jgi:hypothetical protein